MSGMEEVWGFVLLYRVRAVYRCSILKTFTKVPLSIPMTFLQIFCPDLLSVRTLICRHGSKYVASA